MFNCRRLLVLLVVLTVLFAATLSVSASAPVDCSFVFDSDMGDAWSSSVFIPEGRYRISLGSFVSDIEVVYLVEDDYGDYILYESASFSLNYDGISLECYILSVLEDGCFFSSICISNYDSLYGLEVPDLRLIPISSSNSSDAASRLSDIISSIGLDGVFSEVISLLPVLLIVLIGFIGIRKAVSWLISVLRSA